MQQLLVSVDNTAQALHRLMMHGTLARLRGVRTMPWDITGNSIAPTNFLGTTNDQPLVIKTKNKEAVRVDSAGKVGIGTTAQQNLLHVGPGSTSILPTRVNTVVASQNPDAGIAIAQNSGV